MHGRETDPDPPVVTPHGGEAGLRSTVQRLVVGRGEIELVDLPATRGAGRLAPLVFLHEGLGSLGLWRGFPRDVHAATGRRTIVYSRHGYGGSAVVTEPRGVDYMHHEALTVLPELLDRLEVERPVLVGHSDGASIALVHAGSDRTGEVAALVLLAPHVIVEDESIRGIRAARAAFLDTDLEDRLARHHRNAAATFWGWNDIWLSDEFRSWDITDVLGGVRCPVLAVQGLDDEYGTVRQLDLIEAGVPAPVERLHLAGCGHAPHLERPEETTAAVVGFLEPRTASSC